MATRSTVRLSEDGQPLLDEHGNAIIDVTDTDAAPVTEARRTAKSRLAKSRAGLLESGEKLYEPIQTEDGEAWFIRRLTWTEIGRLHISSSRSPGGTLLIAEDDKDLRALTIVALEGCVYTEASEDAKYFESTQDAADYVDSLDSELQNQVRVLFDYALAANPLLLPKFMWGIVIPDRAKSPSPPQTTQEPGLTLTSMSGADGGSETLGTDGLPTSQTEKGDSPTTSTETPST